MGTGQLFSTRAQSRNGVTRVALEGELDLSNVPTLEDRLARAEADTTITGIMLDLRKLRFLDSSGLHAFVAAHAHARANGLRFVVVGVGARMRRLFELTETQFLLDSLDAIELLRRFTSRAPAASEWPTFRVRAQVLTLGT